VTQWALAAGQIMRQTLAGGVTSARDAGGADAGMRAAVELGYTDGPRLQISAVPISQTGGHFDGFLQGPGWDISAEYICPEYPGRPGYLVDGVAGKGTWLVPTLVVWRDTIALAEAGKLPDYGIRKALDLKARIGDAVRIAKAHGVKIALGCDYYLFSQHGRNLEEISLLCQAGLTVEEALLAATWNGAQLCGVSDKLGRIEPGYLFDAIILDRDPSDPAIFEQPDAVVGVFKEGALVVRHPRMHALAGQTQPGP
jgi:imidazolonepropionase-like amidohydrolase